ncbi:MAG TPA: tripartite tricarboxylate transporter substrate-binding protein [Dermatophilaceae bacterium]|nr:tripartite tricarboxylate transporter substrate-binding protein [Dermatophilaceae bacterium]
MRTKLLRVSAAAVAVLTATACGATSKSDTAASSADGAGKPVSGLRLMVPNSPGGGYDTTARVGAKVMEDAKIATGLEVFNLTGAGGTVGLAKLINEKGKGDVAMMMGLGVVGATYTNKAAAKLSGTTPIAKLIEESSGIMVAKSSPYQSIDDLVKAWKANPKAFAVGGGSSPGGPDHLLPMQFAQAVGIDPKKVNYISYDGGGELLPAILGNKLAFAASGTGEYIDQIKSGAVRVLATTGEKRIDSLPDAKTLKEQNVDLTFTNWRGIVAPPGISAAQKAQWVAVFDAMHASQGWKDAMAKNGWSDAYVSGEDFTTFLTAQDKRVADVLTTLGLV